MPKFLGRRLTTETRGLEVRAAAKCGEFLCTSHTGPAARQLHLQSGEAAGTHRILPCFCVSLCLLSPVGSATRRERQRMFVPSGQMCAKRRSTRREHAENPATVLGESEPVSRGSVFCRNDKQPRNLAPSGGDGGGRGRWAGTARQSADRMATLSGFNPLPAAQ